MAPPITSKPRRGLIALFVLLIGLAAIAFWPGTPHNVRLGLDLQGGTQVILVPKPVTPGATITEEQLQQTVAIIRQRVDGLGVAEAEVTTQGSGNGAAIIVSVPGAEQDRVVNLVKRTALLDFRPVSSELSPVAVDPTAVVDPSASPSSSASAALSSSASAAPSSSASAAPSPSSSASAVPSASPSASPSSTSVFVPGTTIVQSPDNSESYRKQVLALDCQDPTVIAGGTPDDPIQWLGTCDQTSQIKFSLEPAFIKGSNVTGATASLPQNGMGGWVVSLAFDSEGAKALATASTTLAALPECSSGASPCNAFAIVLDGIVVSAPRFNEPILGGSAQIEGNFTAQEASDLANVLKYGALPVTLDPVDITSVSPTVGNDQLRAGIIAGLLGLGLVMIYLFIYYRALGLVAILSLIIAAAVTYLTIVVMSKSIGLTLTLAGVAGAIVAIGITADSFIVYFERIRDEIRDGRSLRQACESGWVRARRTLLAADFVSLLAAGVLYFLSVGSVRGFAFVLGLTTVIDVIVAFWFTHPLVVLIGKSSWMQKGSRWTGLDADRVGGHSLAGGVAVASRRRAARSSTTVSPNDGTSATDNEEVATS